MTLLNSTRLMAKQFRADVTGNPSQDRVLLDNAFETIISETPFDIYARMRVDRFTKWAMKKGYITDTRVSPVVLDMFADRLNTRPAPEEVALTFDITQKIKRFRHDTARGKLLFTKWLAVTPNDSIYAVSPVCYRVNRILVTKTTGDLLDSETIALLEYIVAVKFNLDVDISNRMTMRGDTIEIKFHSNQDRDVFPNLVGFTWDGTPDNK